ncbi:hypothetical protein NDA12_001953 [Ustilago hordei]|nr:hypothetical protein NDA12_001953 [Ustilago hordei]
MVILTDHEALKYFKSQRHITGQQARWAILLADFDFILQYRPGDKGGEPDALTRRTDMQPAGEEQDHNVRQLLPPRVFKETADHDSTLVAPMLLMESIASKGLKDLVKIFQPLDQELQEIHRKKPFELKDNLWYSGGRLVIPKVTMPGRTNNRHSRSAKEVDGQSLSVEHLRFMVMTQCHDGITAGHVGRDATIKAAQRHYWWPNMTAWIADYVASCPVCAKYKAPRHHPYGLLQPLATPDRPWGSISLDFIEGLPPLKKYDSKTYDSILVIVDRLTKFAILAPTHKTVTAKQTAVLLYGHMVRLFRYPDHMVSDRGRQFISGAWKAFAEQMGVKHSLSMAYHPQTDGQTERVNQVIEQYLRMYCNYEQNDWANLLDTAAFVYNNMVHNSIGVSPFFACYGWNPKAHPDIPQRLGVNDPGRFEYLMDGKERCKYLQEQIREAQCRSVDQYNRKHKDIEFKVGDMVYINHRNWKTRRPTPKLDTQFAGPYPVQEQVGHQAYQITLPANLRVHDVFHVSMLEPARTSSLPQHAEQPTIPSLPDGDLDFEVEALIDKRSHNGTTEYKVLWRGYSEEAASWEPVENLNCPDLIQEYEVSEGGRVSGPDIDRTEGSSPLRSGDHFKHQVNTLDTRVDATNLITNTINLIIIDITNLITNTINLIIINTHTRPWCHHNIDIDRAELPLNGVSTECHGPGCSRSRRVTGSYGRSTGIEDLVEISREHGRSAVSMETMDSYGLTCKAGPSTATRRTKLKEQAQPRRGPSSRSMQMVTTQGLERQEPKELSLIKGEGAVSKESTPGHEEEEQC